MLNIPKKIIDGVQDFIDNPNKENVKFLGEWILSRGSVQSNQMQEIDEYNFDFSKLTLDKNAQNNKNNLNLWGKIFYSEKHFTYFLEVLNTPRKILATSKKTNLYKHPNFKSIGLYNNDSPNRDFFNVEIEELSYGQIWFLFNSSWVEAKKQYFKDNTMPLSEKNIDHWASLAVLFEKRIIDGLKHSISFKEHGILSGVNHDIRQMYEWKRDVMLKLDYSRPAPSAVKELVSKFAEALTPNPGQNHSPQLIAVIYSSIARIFGLPIFREPWVASPELKLRVWDTCCVMWTKEFSAQMEKAGQWNPQNYYELMDSLALAKSFVFGDFPFNYKATSCSMEQAIRVQANDIIDYIRSNKAIEEKMLVSNIIDSAVNLDKRELARINKI